MKHGDSRNTRHETTYGKVVMYVTPDGQEVYNGPVCSMTQSVSEYWCETCQKWQTVKGIVGIIEGCPNCGRAW